MSGSAQTELADLLVLATYKADIARANIAAARGTIGKLSAEVDGLMCDHAFEGSSLGAVYEKWLHWRSSRVTELNAEIALARVHLANVRKAAARVIAQEEAVKMLLANAVSESKRMKQRRMLEAPTTFPAGRCQ